MITDTMYIGSGDIVQLMQAKQTSGFQKLLVRFTSGEVPYYNAKSSPIDACRTGAILEDRFYLTLGDDWYPQVKVISSEMNVFKASLDFSRIKEGKVVEFIEMKTINTPKFTKLSETLATMDDASMLTYIKKAFKKYYYQVQEQLYCSGLESATLMFVNTFTYDDTVNYRRDIIDDDLLKVKIIRDDKVINEIKEKGKLFQTIKDYFYDI